MLKSIAFLQTSVLIEPRAGFRKIHAPSHHPNCLEIAQNIMRVQFVTSDWSEFKPLGGSFYAVDCASGQSWWSSSFDGFLSSPASSASGVFSSPSFLIEIDLSKTLFRRRLPSGCVPSGSSGCRSAGLWAQISLSLACLIFDPPHLGVK